MTGFFGPEPDAGWQDLTGYDREAAAIADAGWGESGAEEQLPSEEDDNLGRPPQYIQLSNGMRLVCHPDMFRKIMHTPEITAQVAYRCKQIADEANALAITKDAEYTWFVSNRPENIRARGRVKPANYRGRIDNEYHDTLIKAFSNVGSDPKPSAEDTSDMVGRLLEGDPDYDQVLTEGHQATLGHTLGRDFPGYAGGEPE